MLRERREFTRGSSEGRMADVLVPFVDACGEDH